MAGDLEDFLRRAAARRQVKADEQSRSVSPPPKPRPEYSNSRTERQVQPRVEPLEEVITAEIVEDPNSIAARTRKVQKAQKAAEEAKQKLRLNRKDADSSVQATTAAVSVEPIGDVKKDLIAALKRPGGIRQAILLREILDRPEHRW